MPAWEYDEIMRVFGEQKLHLDDEICRMTVRAEDDRRHERNR